MLGQALPPVSKRAAVLKYIPTEVIFLETLKCELGHTQRGVAADTPAVLHDDKKTQGWRAGGLRTHPWCREGWGVEAGPST